MFGYTVPLYGRMSSSDLAAYRGYYCEGCHQLRAGFGLASTAAVNYDMTFNTILLDALSGDGGGITGQRPGRICVLRGCSKDSGLMRRMAGYTLLLTKWELLDDSVDGPSVKSRMASLVLNRAVEKAERLYPEHDRAVGEGFRRLRELEEEGCGDAEMMGREFGASLIPALRDAAGDSWSGELEELFVSLSALVYIMDALDDLDEDYLGGSYNPLLAGSERFLNKKDHIARNLYGYSALVGRVVGSLQTSYAEVRPSMGCNRGVTDNIVYHGLPDSAKRVLTGTSEARMSLGNALSRRRGRMAGV
ncbi:MAG: DUF5685 family protein [Candidatus Methanomethylophilaceae archaeon]|jgi:hypothetical protein|nr:DUF5685 family protein [Candidatus Methanomethylophilaceae archaeon]